MVLLELSQFSGLFHGIIQRTDGIDQLDGKGVAAQPYASLCNLLDLFDFQLTTVCYTFAEQVIAPVDIVAEQCHFLVVERTSYGTEGSVLVGLHLVELHAQLVFQQTAEVGEHAKDAYGTCQRCRFCVDIVGITADVIAATGSIATHGDNYGLLGLQLSDSTPNLFRGIGRATRRVDAEHDCFHVVIFHQLMEIFAYGISHDAVFVVHGTACACVDNLAISIVDGNLLALFLLTLDTRHLTQGQLGNIVISIYLEHLLYLTLHLVCIEQFVDHLSLDQTLLVSKGNELVSIGVQGVNADLTTLGYII